MGGDGLFLALVSHQGRLNQTIILCFRYPESALPARWKGQPSGRRKFSNIFIVFAFVVSFMGFIQPVGFEYSLLLVFNCSYLGC